MLRRTQRSARRARAVVASLAWLAGLGCAFADVAGDATHGAVRTERFASRALGRETTCVVYTPPGGVRAGERLPVIWLLPGYRDDPDDWFGAGAAHHMADRLIAEGALPRCLLIALEGGGAFYVNGPRGDWADYVADEAPRVLAARHAIAPGPAGQALCGNSMGGFGALRLGLLYPRRFGAVASLSGVLSTGGIVPAALGRAQPATLISRAHRDDPLPAIYADCGASDRYGLHGQLAVLADLLAARDPPADYTTHLVPGFHDWTLWRARLEPALRFIGRRLRADG